MTVNANYKITAIEKELWQALKAANVCDVVHPGRRPSSITSSSNTKAFVVARSATDVLDKTAFGLNICSVDIYVKEMGGVKDSATLSTIADKITSALPIITSKYVFTYISNGSQGLDNTGYDVEAYNLNVLIK